MVLIALAVIAMAALVLVPTTKSVNHPPNDDPWVLVNYDPDSEFGTYLGNGFLSTCIKGDGLGFASYISGLYDEERIIPAPNWCNLRFYDGQTQFDLDKNAPYKQTLHMKTGILTTEAMWRAGRKTLVGAIEVMIPRHSPHAGLAKATLVPNFTGSIRADCEITPGGTSLVGAEQMKANDTGERVTVGTYTTRQSGISVSVAVSMQPRSGEARRAGADTGVGVARRIQTEAGQAIDITLLAAVATADTQDAAKEQAVDSISAAMNQGHGKLVSNHKLAMAKLWEHDIIIDGPVADQQALRACKFYLMQSVREGSQWSIAPMGLSSEGYQGHIFWDADIWMFPALILQHPELARAIVDYRFNTLQGAFENAKEDGYQGAQYAWESATSGREVTPQGLVYRHERHINGDVALAQWQYFLATGDVHWLKSRAFPILKGTADWWISKAIFVKENNRYEIHQVVPPDENANLVDNSAYTNAIAKLNLEIAVEAAKLTGNTPDPRWSKVAAGMYIPYDDENKRFIARDNYDGGVAKQADTEMLAYPLQVEFPGMDMVPVYRNTLEHYGPKVHDNGPAMISSVFSVIAARIGDRDKAYKEFLRSYQPYFREPFLLFNEKRSRTFDNTCFLTGAAGPIQAAVFGLAGARMEYFPANPAKAQLRFLPCLPTQWKSMTITGVQWHGETFDVIIGQGDDVTVVRRNP